ncbi:tRNA pseudouridine(55) synthase TruB [Alkalicoccus saliphilus]|uniref:tRNA pseudouridine synthase B n=1 Tax=Alkalicoccus saliphilus TaxID=200989 RepID=A0A2T4U8A4_9BACI|nr:tRNA pseudouridine(55) synthase TruB [Alkalicoccus saliphilus]PTL39616.1 tRNA pseudouridine(55) synthase TruB [Alkalicoccus saliphilus]
MDTTGGIVPLWKPRGMTSFDAVKRIRTIYGTKRAGHTGTLDPDVEGVLPICLERATKLVEYLTADKKVYEGEVTIGFSTDTEDAGGKVIKTTPIQKAISENEADDVLLRLTGRIKQVPPMYSAVKIKGKKLYEYAREGIEIERPEREVTIYKLERLTAVKNTEDTASFSFRAECSKGTYIRTLAVEIGARLGYEAHMSSLIRTSSGSFRGESCVTLEELEKMDDPEKALLTVEEAVKHIPSITVAREDELKVLQGAILPLPDVQKIADAPYFGLYNRKHELLALYKKDEKRAGKMKPEKMIRIMN